MGRCSSKFGKQSRTDAQTLLLTVRPQRVLYAPGLARRRPTHAHSSTHTSRLYTILDLLSLANSLVRRRPNPHTGKLSAHQRQRGWLEDGGYVTAQLVHLGVALSCYAGYFSSK